MFLLLVLLTVPVKLVSTFGAIQMYLLSFLYHTFYLFSMFWLYGFFAIGAFVLCHEK